MSGTITLKKSLQDEFQVGDNLGLSITAHDGAITTRTEIVVSVEAPFHGDAPPVYPNTTEAPDTTTHVFTSIPVISTSTERTNEEDMMKDMAER